MTLTTIKVSQELRDELKAQARARNRTLGSHLQHLVDSEARHERLRAAREAMAANPPDADYYAELREWEGDAWN